MDGADDAAAGAVVCERNARGWWVWTEGVGAEIVRRTAEGETLRGLCRDPAMPDFRTVQRWLTGKRAFRAAMEAARIAAGGPFRGRRTTYCEETAEAIWARLAAGEPLVRIVADPAMPCWSTVHRWMHEQPVFRQALLSARTWLAEQAFQTGWEMCMAVKPETAQAAKVQLAHLRWHTGKMAPKTYGPHKAAEASGTGPREGALHVYTKKFVMGEGRQPGHWSEEPAEHLHSMVPVDDKGPRAGEPLPPPDVIREPKTCQGPNPSRAPRAGAVEAEYDGDDGAGDGMAGDDFWAVPAYRHGKAEDWT